MLQLLTGIPSNRPDPESQPRNLERLSLLSFQQTSQRVALPDYKEDHTNRPCQACYQLESGQQRDSPSVSPLSGIRAVLFYTPGTVVDLCACFDAVSYRTDLAFPGSSLLGRAAGYTGLYHRTSSPARSYKQRRATAGPTRPSAGLFAPSWTKIGFGWTLHNSHRLSDLSRLASITLSAAVWLAACLPLSPTRLCLDDFKGHSCILHAPVRRPRFGLPLSALYP